MSDRLKHYLKPVEQFMVKNTLERIRNTMAKHHQVMSVWIRKIERVRKSRKDFDSETIVVSISGLEQPTFSLDLCSQILSNYFDRMVVCDNYTVRLMPVMFSPRPKPGIGIII